MTASEKRKEIIRLYLSRKGKNSYTQGSNRVYFFGKPEGAAKGYSDCSSSVRAPYLKLLGLDIGSNTEAQVRSPKGVVVDKTDGLYPNEANLLPGDCLYFKGNDGHFERVGHVELYCGDGLCAGHGSGTGPRVHNLRDYCRQRGKERRYYKAIRWIPTDAEESAKPARILVTGGTVNIRSGPGTGFKSIGIVKKDTKLTSAGKHCTGWFSVSFEGKEGYISAKYAQEVR